MNGNDNGSVAGLFFTRVEQYPDNAFLHAPTETAKHYQVPKSDYTYQQAATEIKLLIENYQHVGCGVGTRVGLAMENRPGFFLHLLALNFLGTSVVPLNVGMQDQELEYLISHSECEFIVVHPNFLEQFTRIAAKVEHQPPVIGPAGFEQLPKVKPDNNAAVINADTEAAIIYTSGTTGTPKGCILTNEYFRQAGKFYSEIGGLCTLKPGEDRLITPLPVTHMNALAVSFSCMLQIGGCLIQLDRFHPRSWWQTIRESRATVMHYLGVMPAMLLKAEPRDDDNHGDRIRFGFGAGCDPRHHANFENRFGILLTESWAMSETGAGAWITASEEPRILGKRWFGKVPAGLEYKLVNAEGNEVGVDQPGELLVRRKGDNPRQYFFSGYLKDKQATDEAWAGGWFHTGDEVRVDADGNFYFVDRLKNIIRRSGENIACIEVESVILRHPEVVNCVVAPVPDEIRGDEVAAMIIAEAGTDQKKLAEEVFELCRQQLVYFKWPGYIGFADSIPLTASEKVQRGEVKKIVREMVEQKNCINFNSRKKPIKTKQANPKILKKRPAKAPRQDYAGIVAVAPVSVPYVRYSHQPAHWWIGRALREMSLATGLTPQDVDGFCVSSFTLFPDTAIGLTQHLGLSPRWLDHIPMGGASGVVGMRRAARAIQAGDADIVACVAGDTNQVNSFRNMLTSFSRFSQDAAFPYGSGGPNANFALMTKAYMNEYKIKREDFGKICVAQRENALSIPYAMMKKPLTLDQYMNARVIADPVHLFDCVMPCAGADAFMVMREETAKSLDLPFVRILSTIERHNAFKQDAIQLRGGWIMDRDELWGMAGVTPDQVDLLQTYDDYPVICAMQIEDLGFCEKGGVSEFLQGHTLTNDGSLPHNTSGGQLSTGQAGASGGYLGIVDAIRQLSGQALGSQVADAKTGVVSGFGMINYDRGVCTAAAILGAA